MSLTEDVQTGLVPLRCARDGRTHLVTDADFARGQQLGEYMALCGRPVLVCSLSTGFGERCAGCRDTCAASRCPVIPESTARTTLTVATALSTLASVLRRAVITAYGAQRSLCARSAPQLRITRPSANAPLHNR